MTKTAVFSVFNKANIDVLARFVIGKGYTILSSGGTYDYLKKYVDDPTSIQKIEDISCQPQILNGRVKTLHPAIHGGLLADMTDEQHRTDLQTYNMEKIDLAVVNLYPFERTIETTKEESEIVEQIDIGGHALLRAAAKNFKSNVVMCSPSQYNLFMMEYDRIVGSIDRRRQYAIQALNHVTDYDISISNHFLNTAEQDPARERRKYLSLTKQFDFKYGANPQQKPAALWTVNETEYNRPDYPFTVLNGSVGYINMLDAINAWNIVTEIASTTGHVAAASIKHTSPAGVSISRKFTNEEGELLGIDVDEEKKLSDSAKAYILARNVDPKSSFGDFVAVSGRVDITLARRLQKEVSDGIIADSYDEDALELLKTKKQGNYVVFQGDSFPARYDETKILGNFAMTQINNYELTTKEVILKGAANVDPKDIPDEKIVDMQIANIALKYAQSNSVSMVCNGTLLGMGCGQQSRIDCVRLACEKAFTFRLRHTVGVDLMGKFRPSVKKQDRINAIAKYIENDFSGEEWAEWLNLFSCPIERLESKHYEYMRYGMDGITMASDGFFPFHDNIDLAHKYGVRYIIQPGGSVKDPDVIERCNKHRISMVLSHIRQFHH